MKPRTVRKPIEPMGEAFTPPTIEENDLAMFRQADHFTVSQKVSFGAPRTFRLDDFARAALIAFSDERSMVYAVSATGRSVLLIRERWLEYLGVWKQMNGLT